MNIKIVAISDQHGLLDFKLPSGDILTISGDICPVNGSHHPTSQMHWLNNYFLPWCDQLIKDEMFRHVVFVAGNHDFVFRKIQNSISGDYKLNLPKNVHYLCDSMVDIDGVKIYGTPWTSKFGNWEYMTTENVLDQIFEKIPEGLDILLAHSPAYGWNDIILKGPYKSYSRVDERLGSTSLRKHILRAKPKYFCYGHIHECSHKPLTIPFFDEDLNKIGKSISNCVSILNDDYIYEYHPFKFNISS